MRRKPATGSRATPNGMATTEVCRKHGLSPATFYKLKAEFG